jgi:4a-hydroxytetrahydrobiopterin dehydratase
MATPLTSAKISAALKKLPGWERKGDHLEKKFKFPSFQAAIATMVRISFEAERLNHHPDWTNCYTDLTIRLSTHDAGNKITAKDVELAGRIEALA